MQATGIEESLVILQVSPTLPTQKFGPHAVVFTGRVEVGTGAINQHIFDIKKNVLDDPDDKFSLDLDIVVGPEWRSVTQVAPFIVAEEVWSTNPDEDDELDFGVTFRKPSKWSLLPSAPKRIVLHVTTTQAGVELRIMGLTYNVTATGSLKI